MRLVRRDTPRRVHPLRRSQGQPVNWILFLWLAYSPDTLTPLDQFADREACFAARRVEISANVRAGLGGGATYFCGERDA